MSLSITRPQFNYLVHGCFLKIFPLGEGRKSIGRKPTSYGTLIQCGHGLSLRSIAMSAGVSTASVARGTNTKYCAIVTPRPVENPVRDQCHVFSIPISI